MARVLVVDDEPDIRFLLRRLLEGRGFEVDEASDGQAALELLEQDLPDALVTDGEMPRMDGGELIQRVRDHGTGTPIVLWSANPERYAGADASFAKPLGCTDVVDRVVQLLGGDR